MKIIKEFKEFAIKGNMFDMAIGIIIGTAFNKIISSLVKDVIMPPLGFLIGRMDMNNFKFIIQSQTVNDTNNVIREQITLNYGVFIQTVLDFFIITFTIFIVIRIFNKLRRKSEDVNESSVSTPKDIELLTEIRDTLKKGIVIKDS